MLDSKFSFAAVFFIAAKSNEREFVNKQREVEIDTKENLSNMREICI